VVHGSHLVIVAFEKAVGMENGRRHGLYFDAVNGFRGGIRGDAVCFGGVCGNKSHATAESYAYLFKTIHIFLFIENNETPTKITKNAHNAK